MNKEFPCKPHYILGGIIGDVIGSVFEWDKPTTRNFNLFNPNCTFTDDTVMTVATMKCLLDSTEDSEDNTLNIKHITDVYRDLGRKYYYAGYGERFRQWLRSNNYNAINSFGNGSAMRISPVGWWGDSEEDVIRLATRFSIVSHDHPEGVKGAVAIALAVYYAWNKKPKHFIRDKVMEITGYNLTEMYEHIHERGYEFDATCQGSVPESIISFLAGRDYEDSIINAIWLGGDTDTMACMAGSIAEAKFGTETITPKLREFVWSKLPDEFKKIIADFSDCIRDMGENN